MQEIHISLCIQNRLFIFFPNWWWPVGPKHVVELILNKLTVVFDLT